MNIARNLLSSALAPLVVALLALGCDGAVDGDGGATDASIELGTGEIAFEPIVEGRELAFILGPQGGYHFLASVRVSGVEPGDPSNRDDPRNPTIVFTAWVGTTRVDMRMSSYQLGLEPRDGAPGHELLGRLLILDITDCAQLEDMRVRIEVTVTDADGVVLTDERTVVAVPDPLNG